MRQTTTSPTSPVYRERSGRTETSLFTRSTIPATVAISVPSGRTIVPCPRKKPGSAGIGSPGVTTGRNERDLGIVLGETNTKRPAGEDDEAIVARSQSARQRATWHRIFTHRFLGNHTRGA